MVRSCRFRPPGWSVLLTLVLCALFLRLGLWQVERAEEKKAIISAYRQAAKSPPLEFGAMLAAGRDAASLYTHAVTVVGTFDTAHSLLLDNQVLAQRAGYRVWGPLRLRSGQQVLVDRGWVPMSPDRSVLPEIQSPETVVRLRGVWQPLPRPGLRLAQDDCDRSRWPRVVQYPRFEELRCLLGEDLVEGVLWLDPGEPHGFRREWASNEFPPERHYGYALQWFALAATLLVLFIVVNLRKVEQ